MTSSLLALPSETLDNILDFMRKPDLANFRLTSRLCNDRAECHLLREVTLRNTSTSVGNIKQILESDSRKSMIRVFRLEASNYSQGNLETSTTGVVLEISKLLCEPHRFSHLSAFILHFNDMGPSGYLSVHDRRVADFHSDIFRLFVGDFTQWLSLSQPLRSLKIENLPSRVADPVTSSDAFASLLRELQSLELTVCTLEDERDPPVSLEYESLTFFERIPEVWLLRATNITSLSLSADIPWGYHPKVNFRYVSFPRLKRLSFGNFMFSHDWQLEWLLSHANTLNELVLTQCSIMRFACYSGDTDEEGYPPSLPIFTSGRKNNSHSYDGTWNEYFYSIAESLVNLYAFSLVDLRQELITIRGVPRTLVNGDGSMILPRGYSVFLYGSYRELGTGCVKSYICNCSGPTCQWNGLILEASAQEAEVRRIAALDLSALESLQDTIHRRNGRLI